MSINNHTHHIVGTHNYHTTGIVPQLFLAIPFVLVLLIYTFAVIVSNRRYKRWPVYRTFFIISGVISAIVAVTGPLAERSHMNFTAHMLGHLLLGMLAPLLIVLAAPITLILRTLNVQVARRLSRFLRSPIVRIFNYPIVTSFLNIGGLWLLYTTDLYRVMQQNTLLHVLVHTHVFLAGYLYTAAIIYIDPTPHRCSYIYRVIIFMISLAGHGILSKYIYAHPPSGVPVYEAETGGMLMYFGGDAIDIVIIIILCFQWYRATRPRGLDKKTSKTIQSSLAKG